MQVDLKDVDIGAKFVVVKCPHCDGKGKIPNPAFELCRFPDWRKLEVVVKADCPHCPNKDCKDFGELRDCDICEGNGKLLEFEERLPWEADHEEK